MIRTLYPYPGPVDFELLLGELRSVAPAVIACNDVNGQVAVYAHASLDDQAVGGVVAAHGGPVAPAPDPLHQLAAAIVAATTLDDVKPAAQAILADGDAP
jgi:hypothetical protein